jgi:hypothetical protein
MSARSGGGWQLATCNDAVGFGSGERERMPFNIEFTQRAADHVRQYKKFEQQIILDPIEGQLILASRRGNFESDRIEKWQSDGG